MKNYSKIVSGTMNWGVWGKNLNTKEMTKLIENCFEIGVNCFDHADIYGGYTTEFSFGKSFNESQISRENVKFITKCGIQYICEKSNYKVKHYEYSKKHIIDSIEKSLKNLKTDYIDLMLLHRPSPLLKPEEIAEVIDKLKKEGKVLSFGVSNFNSNQIALLLTESLIEWNQIECSLTEPKFMFDGLLDYLIKNKIKIMAWSPLGSYFKIESKTNFRIKKTIQPLIEKYQASESQILLAWISKHPAKIIPVVGSTSIERLKRSVNSLKIEISTEDWFSLLEARNGFKIP